MALAKTHRCGERVTFDVHADNPARVWKICETFTLYGGRCQSYSDIHTLDMTFPETSRDDAEYAALQWLRQTDRIPADPEAGR